MKLTRLILAAALAVGAHAAAHAQGFSDNELSYKFQPDSREPATYNGHDIAKSIVTLTHVDAGNFISNFVNVSFLKSDNHDPANNSSQGAAEVYAIYRGDISSGRLLGNKISFGPISDISFQFGGDANTKNTAFAPQKDMIVFGPNIHFKVPGYLSLAFHFDKEWGNNGIVGKSVSFDPTLEMEAVYMQPLTFTGLPLRFEGFANLVLPKGKDGFGAQTATEVLTDNQLVLDLGQLIFKKPHLLDGFVGWQYWLNKFGNNHTNVVGSLESTPYFGIGVHF